MGKRRKGKGLMRGVSISVSDDVLREIDEIVLGLIMERGEIVSRSDVVRELLEIGIREYRGKVKVKEKGKGKGNIDVEHMLGDFKDLI